MDIDGVLNNEHHYVSGDANLPNGDYTHFSPTLVKRFNDMCDKICKNFDLKIVLSSSHRMGKDNQQSTLYLKENGITHPCEGRTKYISLSQLDGCGYVNIPRGVEVDEYVSRMDVTNYIILDDDSDFLLKQNKHFFQTDGLIGLTDDIVESILEYSKNCNDDF